MAETPTMTSKNDAAREKGGKNRGSPAAARKSHTSKPTTTVTATETMTTLGTSKSTLTGRLRTPTLGKKTSKESLTLKSDFLSTTASQTNVKGNLKISTFSPSTTTTPTTTKGGTHGEPQ